jgi:hypothetical protein
MRSRSIYFIYFLFTITFSVCGQKTVTGRLVDREAGKPVKDASITQIGTEEVWILDDVQYKYLPF